MNREQATARLAQMSLDECIKMWNESSDKMYARNQLIHETEDDNWWEHLSAEYGTYYLVGDIENSVKERKFHSTDQYFYYNGDDCRLYSFTDKDELMKHLKEWFIDELTFSE